MVDIYVQKDGETDAQLNERIRLNTLAKNAAKKVAEEAAKAKVSNSGNVSMDANKENVDKALRTQKTQMQLKEKQKWEMEELEKKKREKEEIEKKFPYLDIDYVYDMMEDKG